MYVVEREREKGYEVWPPAMIFWGLVELGCSFSTGRGEMNVIENSWWIIVVHAGVGMGADNYAPTNPSLQLQLYWATPSMQVPPFAHGEDQHSSQFVWH